MIILLDFLSTLFVINSYIVGGLEQGRRQGGRGGGMAPIVD